MSTPKNFTYFLPTDFAYQQWYFSGYAVFSSGLSVGLTNIASGCAQFLLAFLWFTSQMSTNHHSLNNLSGFPWALLEAAALLRMPRMETSSSRSSS
jgi:hypothetical protein